MEKMDMGSRGVAQKLGFGRRKQGYTSKSVLV